MLVSNLVSRVPPVVSTPTSNFWDHSFEFLILLACKLVSECLLRMVSLKEAVWKGGVVLMQLSLASLHLEMGMLHRYPSGFLFVK